MTHVIFCSILVTLFVAPSLGSSHEPVEHDAISFNFDPEGGYLVAQLASRCFLVKLTRIEQDHVHTNTGMDDLELKMLREMLGKFPETKIYHDDVHLPVNIQRWCSTRDIYVLERPLDVMTTGPSVSGTVSG